MKTIGILTSGGDAPGMNSAIRSAARTAINNGMRVIGINRGYNGLLKGDVVEINSNFVSDIIQKGGTVLYTARCKEFFQPEGIKKAVEKAKEIGIEGLIVIGGDGSFNGAIKLCNEGLPTVGIPGTIDNDIKCTDYTIGFDTACNIAVEAIDRLRDTARSHEKCSIIEVMGREAGFLALDVGLAVGAADVLVPEMKFDVEKDVCENIIARKKQGKTHHIIVVSEGCNIDVKTIADIIEKKTGIESRITVLGHIQRGGSPTMLDRVYAAKMGHYAVELLMNGKCNRVVAIQRDKVVDFDIKEALSMKKTIDFDALKLCKSISK
ncbi:6-phosphofructokinase [Tyzzerella sp. An114]|uniref:6-phosphofructokinase n=1 Tax=Tyzzerella sp. An114 TaxID=1965545 RepID=UPI000B43848B|nr:6-phosphofructokinase [Tyzzerella sp. An114]OUQ59565.1 6-phosphofructokinase [Tyzzerella sp. An114]